MSISQIVVFFMIYSFMGWVWEMIYIPFEDKCFQNRGFLFGPICPIYGFSIMFLYFLMNNIPIFRSPEMTTLKLFLICMVGSAVVEYVTSWTLETLFHARWWDYSKFPLNINGRVCLPASIFFGLMGIGLAKYAFPLMRLAIEVAPSVVFETLALILMMIFGADYALTQASLSSLLEKIENANREFIEKGESVYQVVASTPSNIKKRISDYEEETREKARIIADGLSLSQKYLVSRITKFSGGFIKSEESSRRTLIGNRMKEYLKSFRKK